MTRFALLCVLLVAFPGAALAAGVDFSVSPQAIEIDTFYNGTTLQIAGSVPDGAQVVLRFTGASEDVHMKQKGKALGLLWMNMNSLLFQNVPKVCLTQSSVPLTALGQAGAGLNTAVLMDKVGIEPGTADRNTLLPELLKLKELEGLYRQGSGAVVLGEKSGGQRRFQANMSIPSRLSPGAYVVEAFAVMDGKIAAESTRAMDVRMVGVPAMMADMAFNHGAWYGVLSSVIALLAGLGVGLVFQSKEPH